ncbi:MULTISPECIES: MarR family transcriptional regulator [unclassified Acinetobacter]|uniref:MarR family winged helix-turn-helix transcriptional regulator n=1 Tax=unclassified Acinetobacter TaxID=196816 RepID=UPI0029342FCD|nr:MULTISPECIES: MarR family transcriptional regulator [unclassified Acinetobacter]WOE32943.1 MarR family transcriptional regulator [Acinetobacter sp. SAAs470]WOE38420.1 MarR family transcriptional regulator [Acinetobacter sp. SAAs474]
MPDFNLESYDQSLYMLHNRLFFRLFQVGNSLDRQCLNELGISPVHWAVLGALSRPHVNEAGMSFSDLTEYLGISRQSLDNILKRLEREGSVERVTSHEDKRAKNVALTPFGQQNWQDLQARFFQFYQQAMASFSLDDLASMIHLLNKVNHGLKQIQIAVPEK